MSSNVMTSDLIVFSHLRWDFVFQRPQHLMSRFAEYRRVFFFETPIFGQTTEPRLMIKKSREDVQVVTPYVPAHFSMAQADKILKVLLNELIDEDEIRNYNCWYYNPMALIFSAHLNPSNIIFDCMDELSGFKDCPQEMKDREAKLLAVADVVFTGGNSIYQAKKDLHHNIHSMPSSIDQEHFHQARKTLAEPQDQQQIPHPRIGFYGVIEERINLDLIKEVALLRPDYHFVIVGPVIRMDKNLLPKLPNIHYLGMKDYTELPNYLSGWDCTFMPFALNEATRYISPTKTPEFLAAGKPLVSTPINDVVHPYASEAELIYIANDPEDFVDCLDMALEDAADKQDWLQRVDAFLDGNSWDATFAKMAEQEFNLEVVVEDQFFNGEVWEECR